MSRLENAEQALKMLGKNDVETCYAFVERVHSSNAAEDKEVSRLHEECNRERARADLNQRELDRVCIERAEERNRADAAESVRDRLRAELEGARAALTHTRDTTGWTAFETLNAHVGRAHKALGTSPGESLEDSARRVVAERDAYHKAKAENDERFMNERDAARARAEKAEVEIAKVRTALLQGATQFGTLEECAEATHNSLRYWIKCADTFANKVVEVSDARDALQKRLDHIGVILGKRDGETLEACAQTYRDRYVTKWSLDSMTDAYKAARAELARLREALGTLASAAGEGGS